MHCHSRAARHLSGGLVFLVRVYQAFLTPLVPSACRFYPSCSHYAVEAIERWGACRGVWLAARRLWRCRPFSSGGYDPVPDKLDAAAHAGALAPQEPAA
jgi:hypothetical protein